MIWHSSDINDVKRELMVDDGVGLSAADIPARIAAYGENTAVKEEKPSLFKRVLRHFGVPVDILLLVIAVIYGVTAVIDGDGGWYQPLIVFALLAANAVADVLVGIRAEQEQAELKNIIAPTANVLRDGERTSVPASHLVPGDIVFLKEGDYIPADGRLLESFSLTCDESAVTGDAAPAEKQAEFMPESIDELSKRKNMVHAGCSVLYGNGKMVVTDTGVNTELARQALIVEITEGKEIPIKRRLSSIGRLCRIAVLLVCFVIFLIGVLKGLSADNFALMVLGTMLTAAALAVCAIPEEAPQAVNIALGFGANRMKDCKAAVQNPFTMEELSRVSVIISDKTGTLTKNRMKMSMLYDGAHLSDLNVDLPGENAVTLIRTAALCTDSDLEITSGGKQRPLGDPTEVGIISACMEYCGINKTELENIYPRMASVPFDSERKLMTTVNMINNRPIAIVKGSPDILVSLCTGGNIEGALKAAEEMNKRGLRTIAVAIKPLAEVPANANSENMECDLNLLGLFGLTDTISRETTSALRESETGGIRTVMITGDHVVAAEAIAKSMGIMRDGQKSVTGEELQQMDDDTLYDNIYDIAVYSRISTADKLRVVDAFRKRGETVAVTGDSAADSAVLRAADVGCAMGVNGTDIAKGSADIVLTEDSYISIVKAIKESRGVYFNIKKIASFVLSCAIGELLLMLLEMIIFGVAALSAPALLWVNLICAFGLIVGLAAEGTDDSVMAVAPLRKKESFFMGEYGIRLLCQGLVIALIGMLAYSMGGSAELFAALIFSEATLAYALRSPLPLLKIGPAKNKLLLMAMGVSFVAVLVMFVTPLHYLFGLSTLSAFGLFVSLLLSLIPLAGLEAYKYLAPYFTKNKA